MCWQGDCCAPQFVEATTQDNTADAIMTLTKKPRSFGICFILYKKFLNAMKGNSQLKNNLTDILNYIAAKLE